MTAMLTAPADTRTVDARGSFCPGPLMELIRAIRESAPGQVIAVYSSDPAAGSISRSGSRRRATGSLASRAALGLLALALYFHPFYLAAVLINLAIVGLLWGRMATAG